MTYLKTKSYDHLLDVLRQLGSDSQDRPIVVRFIRKYVIRYSHNIITFLLRWSYNTSYDKS